MKTALLKFAYTLLFLCVATQTFAQTYNVTGKLVDATDTSALIEVSVVLTSTNDTSVRAGTVTDEDGNFEMDNISPGKYQLSVIYVGYKPINKTVTVADKNVDLGLMKMTANSNELHSVTVTGKEERASQLGDTTQFNANAFKTHPDATAEDLVTKMPGVTSDNSGVKVNGESVQQVYVDGKPFFGTDPTLALRNLPAEEIDKIQVFDKLSDQSQFTGFDDGNSQKTINIVTKANKSNGFFGKVYAGYGTDETYLAGGNLNYFDGDRRISIIGLANNINQQNFSSQDILGVTGGGGGGNRGGSSGGGGRGAFGGGGANNFLVGQQGGITTTNSIGLNYSDNWGKKIKVTASYFYNVTDNVNNTDLTRNYFTNFEAGNVYHESDSSEAKNFNHRFNVRFEYTIDSFNSLIITPSLSLQNNNTRTGATAVDSLGQHISSSTVNDNDIRNNGYTFSNNLLFQHKFQKPRRTISLNVNTSLNEKSGTGSYNAYNQYYEPDSASFFDQQYTLYNNGYTVGGNITYTEPIGKKGQVMANYYPSYTKSYSNKETDNLDTATHLYDNFDTLLSNRYYNTYITQRGGLSYRIGDRKLSFMFGANLQYATLQGEQYFPYSFNVQRNFTDVLPIAMFNYRFSDGRNLRIFYRTSTIAPSVTQLQNVVDISNPLLLKTGNPNLRQDYEQTLILRYGLTKAKTANTFFVYMYANYVNNYIGNATLIPTSDSTVHLPLTTAPVTINRGSQLTLPVNVNGYFNGRAFGTYGIPVEWIKSNLNLNGGFSYTRTPGQVNDIINYSDNYVPSLGVVLSSNISQNVDFTLSYSGNYNIVKNSVQSQANNNYYSHVAAFKINVILLKNVVLNSSLTHNYYTAFSSTGDQSYFLWTAYAGYKFLKSKALEARLTCYDILNQNKSISRTVTDTYVENDVTQVLKQYFMFQLTYTFRNFKGALPETNQSDGEGHGHWRDLGGTGGPGH